MLRVDGSVLIALGSRGESLLRVDEVEANFGVSRYTGFSLLIPFRLCQLFSSISTTNKRSL
jgi:hypothetical protein